MSRRLIRVFPRRTKATPNDALARFNVPDLYDEADEVHVSVTFHDHDASGRRGPWPDLSGEGGESWWGLAAGHGPGAKRRPWPLVYLPSYRDPQ